MYVSIAIVRAILDSLRQQGVATPEFCSRIGLQPEEFSDPTHRLPVNRVDSIVRAAIAVTGDPALGLHVGESAPVGALHVVGHLLANSGSLREAIQLYVRYAPLIVEARAGASSSRGTTRASSTSSRPCPTRTRASTRSSRSRS